MKKFLIALLFLAPSIAFAAPNYSFQKTMLPDVNAKWELGTTSPTVRTWYRLYVDGICLTADTCRTTWPSGGGGGGGTGTISTSSPLVAPGVLYATSASTAASAATTTLTASSPLSLSQPIFVIGPSASVLTISTSGTWTGLAGTATALAANGTNCSSGSYPLGVDAGGNSENCTVATTGTVTAVTAVYPLASTGGATPAISSATSSASSAGVLSAADWTAFNAKESALTFSLPLARTSNTISWTGLATTTQPASSNLLVSNGLAGVYGVGTSSLGVTGPITFSGTIGAQVGGVGGTFGCATCVLTTRAITIAGNTNQITSSAGSQDLSSDRTWTLSLPALVVFPGSASTTRLSVADKAYFGGSATSTVDSTGLFTFVTAPVFSTLTGIIQGKGASAASAITDSSTVGQTLRVTGSSAYGWGALDLANSSAVTGILPILNGGTASSTSGSTNGIWYNSGTNKFANASIFTYLESGSLLTVANATTTALTVSTFFGLPNSASCAPSALGGACWDTTENQLQIATTTAFSAVLSTRINPSFSYSTSTAWTGTTTKAIGIVMPSGGETYRGIRCFTTVGTLNFQIGNGSASSTMYNASTTSNFNTINKSFAQNDKIYVSFGTPASSPTAVSCTVEKTVNPS